LRRSIPVASGRHPFAAPNENAAASEDTAALALTLLSAFMRR
jgi:hypothetical protein